MRTILICASFWTDHPLGRGWAHQPLGSGCAFALALCLFRLARKQDGTDAMQVARDHGQRDVALEAVDAMIGAAVQAMHFQGVDGRLDGAVAPAQGLEIRVVFARVLGLRALALFRQHREVDEVSQRLLVRGTVETFVEAHAVERREAYDELLHQRHGDLIIGLLLHHPVVEDEAVLVCR